MVCRILIIILSHLEYLDTFLIYGPNCKIRDLNPFDKDAMKIFKRSQFEPCSLLRPLTSVASNFDNDTMRLIIHEEHKADYLAWWQKGFQVK